MFTASIDSQYEYHSQFFSNVVWFLWKIFEVTHSKIQTCQASVSENVADIMHYNALYESF